MKRFNASGKSSFARFAIHPHSIRTTHTYRGGVRF